MLIIPDASLGLKDIQFLNQWRIPYLIIDHHDINHQKNDLDNHVHLFNNQWRDSKINPEFTGVDMAYQYARILDKINHTDYAKDYLYLLSIGQVGDVSDISNPEIRYYVLKGFKQMVNIRLLKLTTATDRLSAHELSFSIIPKINAVCRTGPLDDKRDLLNALVDNEPDDLVKISFRHKSHIDHKFHKHYKNVDHYYLEAKELNRIKSRQKRAVKKSLRVLDNVFETKSFIIALDKSGQFKQEEAGLITTQLSSKYQKPAIVMRTCGQPNVYKGSARGNVKIMADFRRFCNQTQKFIYTLGHSFRNCYSQRRFKDVFN